MDIEKIRELRLAWPFKPFDLTLEDGRKLFVRMPYHLAFAPTDDFMLFTGDRPGFETFSPLQVKRVVLRKNGVRSSRGSRARGSR